MDLQKPIIFKPYSLMTFPILLPIQDVQKFPPWYLLKLSRPENYSFSYGQYVELVFPDGEKKYLAIASSPHLQKELFFIIKAQENIRIPQEVYLSQAKGGFPKIYEKEKLFFITHGVGISAFTGLLYDIAQGHLKKTAICLWGIRFSFEKDLLSYLSIPLNLVTTVYSRERDGLTGYVQDHIEKFFDKDFAYYISGSKVMAEQTEAKLISLGVPQEQVYYNF